MSDDGDYSSPSAVGAESFGCMDSLMSTRKIKNKNKRRFSDEQIRSLETMFESEVRLEPRKKLQLARELGLQPRQVAIWFQNKRARWKSKQLERDYSILLANYNNLASRFEGLKKEKQSLVVQLQKMNDMQRQQQEESQSCREGVAASTNKGKLENIGETTLCETETEVKPSLSLERSEHGLSVLSDDDSSMKVEYFGLEDDEHNILNMVEPAEGEGSLTSSEDWGNFNSDGLFNQSNNTNYQWWDFWS